MLVWFLTLATLGIVAIFRNPDILFAINPQYAFAFFANNGTTGLSILGVVFLVVTGGEALYADMGHFVSNRFASRGSQSCCRHYC